MVAKSATTARPRVARKAREIIVEIEDTRGTLAGVLGELSAQRINLLAYSALSLQNVGVLHLLPENSTRAQKALAGTGATKISVSDIVYAVCPDKIGAGAETTRKLSEAGINIHYSYATSTGGRKYGVVFQTEDNAKAVRVLNR